MKINRRRFLLSSALVGGGVLIGYTATRPSRHRRGAAGRTLLWVAQGTGLDGQQAAEQAGVPGQRHP